MARKVTATPLLPGLFSVDVCVDNTTRRARLQAMLVKKGAAAKCDVQCDHGGPERWVAIDGASYEVSSWGRMRHKWSHTKKASTVTHNGYEQTDMVVDGVKRWTFVHRLVAIHFIGEVPEGHVVAHIDGQRSHNCVSNLRVVTHAENMLHKRFHGTAPCPVVTQWNDVVRERLRDCSRSAPTKNHRAAAAWAKHYGRYEPCPIVRMWESERNVRLRERARGVAEPCMTSANIGEKNRMAKLTEHDVRVMRARHASGEPATVLAREFGISHMQTLRIVKRQRWRHV